MSSESDAEGLSPDLVFDLLSSQRRRMILYYLRQTGQTVTVNELSRAIAAMENRVPAEELTPQQKKRVYVSLYQTHLPKLAEAGVIDYDRDGGIVELSHHAYQIDGYLVREERVEYPWSLHYLVLGAVSVAVLSLSLAGVPGFVALAPIWTGVLITAAFGLSAVAQFLLNRRQDRGIPSALAEESIRRPPQ